MEATEEAPPDLSGIGFARAQAILKDFKGSFTETLLEELRQSR